MCKVWDDSFTARTDKIDLRDARNIVSEAGRNCWVNSIFLPRCNSDGDC